MLFNCTQAIRFCPKTNFTSVATTELTLSMVLDNSSPDSGEWGNEEKLAHADAILTASDLFTQHAQSPFPSSLPDINFALCQQFADSVVLSVKGNGAIAYVSKEDASVNVLEDASGKGTAIKVPYLPQLKVLLLTSSAKEAIRQVFSAGTFASALIEVEKGGLSGILKRSRIWGFEFETDFAAVYLNNL